MLRPPWGGPDPLPGLQAFGGCSPGDLNHDGGDELVLWRPLGDGWVALLDGRALWNDPGSMWDAVVVYWNTGPGDDLDHALCDSELGRVYFVGKVWDAAVGSSDGSIFFWP